MNIDTTIQTKLLANQQNFKKNTSLPSGFITEYIRKICKFHLFIIIRVKKKNFIKSEKY